MQFTVQYSVWLSTSDIR